MPPKSTRSDSTDPRFSELYKSFAKDYDTNLKIEFIPSGSIIMDCLMGGGLPLGKYIEIYSPAGLGKTCIALHIASSVIEHTDRNVVYIDAEKGLTDSLIKGPLEDNLGKRFGVFRLSTFEEVEKLLGGFMVDKKLALVIIDSITAVIPQVMVDSAINEIRPGIKAQYESIFLNKFKTICARHNFSILFINQVRTKLNFRRASFEEGSGSLALKHYVDVRFKVSALKYFKDEGGNNIGAEVEVKSVKNKIAGNVKATLVIKYGKGVNNIAAYISYLATLGFVKQSGSYYELTLPGEESQKFKGGEAFEEFVKANIEKVEKILVAGNIFKSVSLEEIAQAEGED